MTMTVSPIVPSSTALLLMDFRPAVLASVPGVGALLARIRAALSWARSQKVQVCYVRVAFTDEDFRAVPAHSKAFAAIAKNKFLAATSWLTPPPTRNPRSTGSSSRRCSRTRPTSSAPATCRLSAAMASSPNPAAAVSQPRSDRAPSQPPHRTIAVSSSWS